MTMTMREGCGTEESREGFLEEEASPPALSSLGEATSAGIVVPQAST